MAQIPDNIVSVMMVDNTGAVVSVPVDGLFSLKQTESLSTQATVAAAPVAPAQTSVINNVIENTVELGITADPNYVPIVNGDKTNLLNSVLYQSSKKIGLNTKNPKHFFDVYEGSINVENGSGKKGYKINGYNLAYSAKGTDIIYVGDSDLKNVSLDTLYLSGTVVTPTPLTYNQLIQVEPDGKVSVVTPFPIGSIPFSDGYKLVTDVNHLFWDDTNNRLGVLTNMPAYTLDVNGTARVQTSLITPIIGNTLGVTANNTWTYTSNVNVPLVPVDAAHAASKQYVDNVALTGLKLGAEIKTVSTSNIGLSGLATINGYTPVAGDRILVIGQTAQTENGVYDAASGSWSRSTDSDSDAELRGYQYLITAGTYVNARYGNTNLSVITIGSTNITYQTISAGEADPIFTASPSFSITNTNISNWGTAYSRSLTSLTFTGTSTQTLTLTKQDGSTLTGSFTFPVTSVFGRTGAVVLTSSDISTALGYTPYDSATNSSGYISSVTYSQVISALTFTPMREDRTITINGTTKNVKDNPSFTIASGVTSFNGLTGDVTFSVVGSLGYTPYNATNPAGYTSNVGTVVSVGITSAIGLSTSSNVSSGAVSLTVGALTDNMRINSLRVGSFTGLTVPTAVDGRVEASGDIVGYSTSDERLKKDINVIPNAIDKLSRIRGVKFNWKEEFKHLHGFEGADMGVIAQDLVDEFPEALTTRDSGYLAVRYEKLIGLLVAAVNEQSEEIKQLKNKLK